MTEPQTNETSDPQRLTDPPPGGFARKIMIGLSLGAVLLAIVTVWSVPRPTGDLYVGLAAGRDIVDGKMGKLDDWAFTNERRAIKVDGKILPGVSIMSDNTVDFDKEVLPKGKPVPDVKVTPDGNILLNGKVVPQDRIVTQGRVWINQNWGTNLLYWVSHKLGDETGLLVLKLLLIAVGSTFLVLACRKRDADWPVALLVAAGVIAAGRSFIDLRPNLTTLMFVPVMLFLLYRTAEKPKRIWLAMVMIGVVWANLHGGFTLGLLAMFFWAFCVVFLPMIGRRRLARWVPGMAIAAAAAACIWFITKKSSNDTVVTASKSMSPGTVRAIWTFVSFAFTLGVWWVVRFKVAGQEPVEAEDDGSIGQRAKVILRAKWPYVAAAFGAVVLAGVVTPFGIFVTSGLSGKLAMPFWEMWNLTHPLVVTFSKESDIWRKVIEWNSIFIADENAFGSSWEFFTIVGIFCSLVPLSVMVKIVRKKLLNVEDAVLLAIIIGLTLVIIAQAAPVYSKFGASISSDEALNKLVSPDKLSQYYGWLSVLIIFPLIGMATIGVSIAAISAWMRQRKLAEWSAERIGIVVFDVCMAMGGIKLAFGARRFMPLAAILLAPLLARRLQWLFGWLGGLFASSNVPAGSGSREAAPPARGPRWFVPTALLAAVLIFAIGSQARKNYLRYQTDSPLVRYKSVLKNMIVYNMFPPNAKDFILDNGLTGRCFNEWRWEGYLRWYCPKLKMFIGGRAQQAYSIKTYQIQQGIIGGLNPNLPRGTVQTLIKEMAKTGAADDPVDLLDAYKVRWIIVPWDGSFRHGMYARLIYKAAFEKAEKDKPGSHWVPVFWDGENIILANSRLPECREVIASCLRSRLAYRDKAYADLSRGLCLASAKIHQPDAAVKDIEKAQQLKPISGSYVFMSMLFSLSKPPTQADLEYLESEDARLKAMDWHKMDGLEILRCRFYALNTLYSVYNARSQVAKVRRIEDEMGKVDEQIGEAFDTWN